MEATVRSYRSFSSPLAEIFLKFFCSAMFSYIKTIKQKYFDKLESKITILHKFRLLIFFNPQDYL